MSTVNLFALTQRARTAACANDVDGLMLVLLEAWRERRARRLADVIFALSNRFLRRSELLADLESWQLLASRADPLSVTALLADPPRTGARTLKKMASALLRFPPDPRIAQFAHQTGAWLRHTRKSGRDHVLRLVRELHAAHGPLGPLSPDPEIDWLCETAALLPPSIEDSLLAALWAAPDEETRRVYADWLIDQGDPLGEDFSSEDSPERSHSKHHDRWIYHHYGLLRSHQGTIVGGLVRRVSVGKGPLLVTMPAWSTVEEIAFSNPTAETIRSLGALSWLPRLQFVEVNGVDLLDLWSALAQSGLPEIGLSYPNYHLGQLVAWPELRCLWFLETGHAFTSENLPHFSTPIDVGVFSSEPFNRATSHNESLATLLVRALLASVEAPEEIARIRVQRPNRMGFLSGLTVTIERSSAGSLRRLSLAGICEAHEGMLSAALSLPPILPRDLHTQRQRALAQLTEIDVQIAPDAPTDLRQRVCAIVSRCIDAPLTLLPAGRA